MHGQTWNGGITVPELSELASALGVEIEWVVSSSLISFLGADMPPIVEKKSWWKASWWFQMFFEISPGFCGGNDPIMTVRLCPSNGWGREKPPARRLMITKSNIQDSSSAVIPDADFSDPNQKVILQIVRMQQDARRQRPSGKGIWNFTSPKFNSDLVATNWWSLMTIYSIALYIYIMYKYNTNFCTRYKIFIMNHLCPR